ncbi:hypothetical protein PILCRDRAFT_92565 [Piloderma croceum F 1598]|uniref:Uncharacterized protein n=1 Tax=Piloderma croceum (strain F 1598) TaxID=765440 RepID=A0A0C3F367_PILCF|nr:hypothetical protein PILCRDRAFT_92565 [Piloderma croceum F 1598]
MLYYYRDNTYKYNDDSYYGNNTNNNNNNKLYLNYTKSDHHNPNPEPPLSKPDLYGYNNVNTTRYSNNANCEDTGWKFKGNMYDREYRHGEPKFVAEGESYKEEGLNSSEYELPVLKYKDMERDNGVYKPHESKHSNNRTYKPKEPECMSHKWGYPSYSTPILIPSAVTTTMGPALIEDFWHSMEDCKYKQEEWEADKQAKIHEDH